MEVNQVGRKDTVFRSEPSKERMKAKKGECAQDASPVCRKGMRLGEMSHASWERSWGSG